MPVISGCEGARPAQIRDKSRGRGRLSPAHGAPSRSPRRRRRRGQKRRIRGAIYARFSHRDQHSIEDQVRACHEFADANGIDVRDDLIFSDRAVRGCRRRRTGLQALQQALENDAFDVLLVFVTSRLYRKTYKSLGFVEEEIVDRSKRCVFVRSGIDTADQGRWRQLLQMHAMIDEFSVQMSAEHIRVAHEGLMEAGMVWGTLAYGYCGEAVDGQHTKRNRPRQRTVINPVETKWVRRVFRWYVNEGLSIGQCIRRLNREKAPLPPKCTTGVWTRQAVRLLLSNPRYRGFWEYGKTQAVYLNRQDYVRQVPRDKPLRQIQVERLRVVDDATWYQAQALLANEPRRGGRKAKNGDRKRRPALLNGLLFCKEHDRRMHVGGAHGRYYMCPMCQRLGEPALFTLLNRELAVKIVSDKCASLIRQDAALADRVAVCCREHAESTQRPDPSRLSELRVREQKLTRRIQFILDNAGESSEDRREDAVALAGSRAERARLRAGIAALEAAASRQVRIPARAEVQALLDELGAIMQRASSSGDEEEITAGRRTIEMITGGRIYVTQAGEPKPKRGWLRGMFQVRLLESVVEKVSGATLPTSEEHEAQVEFREPPPEAELADEVKRHYDQGLRIKDIAARLGIHRNLVVRALRHAFAELGQKLPDGRARWAALRVKSVDPPAYQRVAEDVMQLWRQGRLLQDIAKQLRIDRNAVTKAVGWWHASRGLPVPDGRARRKTLKVKTSKRYRAQVS